MRYTLLIKKQAKKALQSLGRTDRNRIAEKIKCLGDGPDNPSLDIKPLQGEPDYALGNGALFSTEMTRLKLLLSKRLSHAEALTNDITNYQIH